MVDTVGSTKSSETWCPELRGRTVIITGAGRYRSIGCQIALEFARQGANLVLTGTGRAPSEYPAEEQAIGWRDIDSVVEQARALGGDGLAVISDIGNPDAADELVDAATERFGAVDYLINNAGAAVGGDRMPLHELSPEQWRRVMRVNLDGAFYTAGSVARHLVQRQQGGAIINISSIASRQCLATSGAYSASKAGLNAMSRTMAVELAPHRIRVNSVLPGLVKTSRVEMTRESWDELVKSYVPLGAAGDGSEIANMCAFLCSDRGCWITGQEIGIDGGTSWR